MATRETRDKDELEGWLLNQPRQVSAAIAVRCSLRILPILRQSLSSSDFDTRQVLETFRDICLVLGYLNLDGVPKTKSRYVRSVSEGGNPASMAAIAATNAAFGFPQTAHGSSDPRFGEAMVQAGLRVAVKSASTAMEYSNDYDADAANNDIALLAEHEPAALSTFPLWPDGALPDELAKHWEELKSHLFSLGEDWNVWTDWYEDRLSGRFPESETLEIARVTLIESTWRQGPKFVNAAIRELTELVAKGGDEAVEARMEDFRREYSEQGSDPEKVPIIGSETKISPGDVKAKVPDPGSSQEQSADPDHLGARFGKLVRERREALGLSRKAAGEKAFGTANRGNTFARIENGKTQRPQAQTVRAIAAAMNLTDDDLKPFAELLGASPPVLPPVWIYLHGVEDNVMKEMNGAGPGSLIHCKIGETPPDSLNPGDLLLYWRKVDGKQNRWGLIGHGTVTNPEPVLDSQVGFDRIETRVTKWFEDKPIRDEIVKGFGLRPNWPGYNALTLVSGELAQKIDVLLRSKDLGPLFENETLHTSGQIEADESQARANLPEGEIRVRRDDAERDKDALGRGPLAVSLATILHEIWCTEQGLKPYRARTPQKDAAGFVAHIDAPWGGGKTSFANLIARVLDPALDGKETTPAFLKDLYPEREDLSGLFMKDTAQLGNLKNPDDTYKWDQRARRPWIVVPFNAWLNQHMEPPWWSFYQTIRKGCFKAIGKEGVPIVRQTEDGSYKTVYENALNRFDRIRGLWLRELWWRLTTPKVRNAFYTFCVVVAVSLLLRAFGLFDLKALQTAFTATDKALPAPTLVTTGVMVLLGGASAVWSVIATATQSLLPGTPEAAKNYSLGSTDPLNRFRNHFANMMEAVERPVLVIIDDIDRCEPTFIVEMTRGLQTILKSPRVVFLLLGDKNWIEQAFEVCHKDMKDIDVGPEHTFGGRFVEKAIQLSYVLPGIGEKKADYVSTVLIGRVAQQQDGDAAEETQPSDEDDPDKTPEGEAGPTRGTSEPTEPAGKAADRETENEVAPDLLREITDSISKANTLEEIDQFAAQTVKTMQKRAPETSKRGIERAVRNTVILQRTARRSEVEEAIRHRLQPLGRYLPGNPRHIKRIINAVSMYQNSLVSFEEDQQKTVVGGERWRQLVIGVVLMIGYPKSWNLLAKHPDWAAHLVKANPKLPGKRGSGSEADEIFASLSRNGTFIALMKDTKLADESDKPVTTEIDEDAVKWLNRIVPTSGG